MVCDRKKASVIRQREKERRPKVLIQHRTEPDSGPTTAVFFSMAL